MNKRAKLSIVAASVTFVLAFTGCGSSDTTNTDRNNKDFELRIAHINDTHSHIDSETYSLYFDGKKTYTDFGGYGKVIAKIKEIQDNHENVLTLNAGDTFQGTLYYTLFKGDADAELLKMIEWDAIELGNHEFDDGDEHLADYLEKLDIDSSKVLASNIEVQETNPLYALLLIFTRDEAKANWHHIDTVDSKEYNIMESREKTLVCRAGERKLENPL